MIEDRLAATLRHDAVNGDSHERNIVAQQIKEAIATIKDLRDTKTDTRSILIEKNPRVIKNVLEKEKC